MLNVKSSPSIEQGLAQSPQTESGQPATRRLGSARSSRSAALGSQFGIALVEAMVAVVIFSIGILGIVAMQARSTQMMTDSLFRAQASQVATELLSEMWTSDPSQRVQQFASAVGGVRYMQWKTRFEVGANALPGAAANPPIVTVQTVQMPLPTVPPSNYTSTDITITVFWQRAGAPVSRYTTTARITEPQS